MNTLLSKQIDIITQSDRIQKSYLDDQRKLIEREHLDKKRKLEELSSQKMSSLLLEKEAVMKSVNKEEEKEKQRLYQELQNSLAQLDFEKQNEIAELDLNDTFEQEFAVLIAPLTEKIQKFEQEQIEQKRVLTKADTIFQEIDKMAGSVSSIETDISVQSKSLFFKKPDGGRNSGKTKEILIAELQKAREDFQSSVARINDIDGRFRKARAGFNLVKNIFTIMWLPVEWASKQWGILAGIAAGIFYILMLIGIINPPVWAVVAFIALGGGGYAYVTIESKKGNRIVQQELAGLQKVYETASEAHSALKNKIGDIIEENKSRADEIVSIIQEKKAQIIGDKQQVIQEKFEQKRQELICEHEQDVETYISNIIPLKQQFEEEYVSRQAELDLQEKESKEQLDQLMRKEIEKLNKKYETELEGLKRRVENYCEEYRLYIEPWERVHPDSCGNQIIPYIRFASYPLFSFNKDFYMPLLLPIDQENYASLVIETTKGKKGDAVSFLQSLLGRLLIQIPAGKMTFTLVDPQEMGRPFSSLLHLGDYDKQLITEEVLTNVEDVRKELQTVWSSMKRNAQTRLRSFSSIYERNEKLKEIDQPYQAFVFLGFPSSMQEEDYRNLLRIIEKGHEYGIMSFFILDSNSGNEEKEYAEFMAELREKSVVISCEEKNAVLQKGFIEGIEIKQDRISDEMLLEYVEIVGKELERRASFSVNFDELSISEVPLWKEETELGITIPIGLKVDRSPQYVCISDALPHTLIAGDGGSGKSNLLHTLITAAMMKFSPHELEIHLFDGKNGIDFYRYGQYAMPHIKALWTEPNIEQLQHLFQEIESIS